MHVCAREGGGGGGSIPDQLCPLPRPSFLDQRQSWTRWPRRHLADSFSVYLVDVSQKWRGLTGIEIDVIREGSIRKGLAHIFFFLFCVV